MEEGISNEALNETKYNDTLLLCCFFRQREHQHQTTPIDGITNYHIGINIRMPNTRNNQNYIKSTSKHANCFLDYEARDAESGLERI